MRACGFQNPAPRHKLGLCRLVPRFARMPLRVSRHNLLLWIVTAAFFMQNLDGTIITTALPQMAVTFDTTPIPLSIGITAYILSLAVLIPVSGWLADRLGARTVFGFADPVLTPRSG